MGMTEADRLSFTLAAIAAEAGRMLARIEDRGAGRMIKSDGSPSTAADLASERLILSRLAQLWPDVPVVAEESADGHAGEAFILVDPLDGTKDYLTGSGEYSVNIAFVRGRRPIAAALCAPTLDRVWAAGSSAFQSHLSEDGTPGTWTSCSARRMESGARIALCSRRHGDVESDLCLERLGVGARRTASSAAKFGLIASGEADIYVRCGNTMEWDTAAGDHILTMAGGIVTGPDGAPLSYGHAERGFLNGPFAALGDPSLAAGLDLPRQAIIPRPGST